MEGMVARFEWGLRNLAVGAEDFLLKFVDAVVAESGGDFFTEAEMLFDRGNAPKGVIDFFAVAGVVIYRGFEFLEPLLDIGKLLHNSGDVLFRRHLSVEVGDVAFELDLDVGDIFGERRELYIG
jgi:hypothetical protein